MSNAPSRTVHGRVAGFESRSRGGHDFVGHIHHKRGDAAWYELVCQLTRKQGLMCAQSLLRWLSDGRYDTVGVVGIVRIARKCQKQSSLQIWALRRS